ncbi:regulator of nonsense transcripts 3A isoform X3 [Phacochoerus africanus]|uniref:regulator of nonsense transcripts 3A isoform X3 n=1 Tax=Phacochoerus africanus TaxID=41426 RepID=UPI001FD903E2|nr:regulator of nonsense transcripts 3A isoform X3 [Phacochoerus africanus]
MRSEKEGGGGPRVAVVARGPSGREKALPAEIQICQESLRREPDTPLAPSSGSGGNGGKPREEKRTVLSKVVVRRLPPSLTREQLEEQLQPLPAHDYFEFFTADLSLYPHLYSRAYINFRNPDDILLFRDRFDGYIFIDSKGLEYPAVVEFAPFQKIAKKKLKKKDTKTGSIEDDPEYKKFLETYCVEEEKAGANPETLLGDVEAKTRELIARRTTPLLEYIKNRKLEKQRIREEKREERRRRELEKKRLREEEKRRRREEERCKKKAAEKQKKTAEKEVRVKLLKKPEKGEEPGTENPKEGGEAIDFGGHKMTVIKSKGTWREDAKKNNWKQRDTTWMTTEGTELTLGWTSFQEEARRSRDGAEDSPQTEAREGARMGVSLWRRQRDQEGRGVTTDWRPGGSAWETRTGWARSRISPELASEPSNAVEDPLRGAVMAGGVRQKTQQGLHLRRVKRQSLPMSAWGILPGLPWSRKTFQKCVN